MADLWYAGLAMSSHDRAILPPGRLATRQRCAMCGREADLALVRLLDEPYDLALVRDDLHRRADHMPSSKRAAVGREG